jgi:hypothetical protein
VAKKIYEEETSCSITDVSCVQHPVHAFLGASPDGIVFPTNEASRSTRYGRLVEFKCPFSRVAKDGVPAAYIHQMQMQMECTGIDECEYVEFRFKQVNFTAWDESTLKKGVFAVADTVDYKPDNLDLHEWQCTLTDEHQYVYWVLTDIKKDFVPKDPEWLPTHLPDLKAFWDDVIRHRENGTKPEPLTPKMMALDI